MIRHDGMRDTYHPKLARIECDVFVRDAGKPLVLKQPLKSTCDRRDEMGHAGFVNVSQAAHAYLLRT